MSERNGRTRKGSDLLAGEPFATAAQPASVALNPLSCPPNVREAATPPKGAWLTSAIDTVLGSIQIGSYPKATLLPKSPPGPEGDKEARLRQVLSLRVPFPAPRYA